MLSVAEAIEAILREVPPFAPVLLPLSETLGLVLAEDIHSDVDSPPFDKSLVDGFAVRLCDLQLPTVQALLRLPTASPGNSVLSTQYSVLPVIEVVSAGQIPTRQLGEQPAAIQIMTGAPIPLGADAVVPVEVTSERTVSDKTRLVSIPINVASWKSGTNIVRQGASLKRGELVIAAGAELRPQELGALAELGHATVRVRRRPRVAVLATGDELVPVEQTPGPGQIRNSNETMLCAQIHRAGGEPVPLGIARDERTHLRERIASGLQADVLVLSGGVSMGEKDLVPSELAASGVRQVFHKVNVKPGKPVWFGVQDGRVANRCLVFGLPGNPVSSLVCFELFVRPALRRLMGFEQVKPLAVKARLTQAHATRGDRPTYHPARLEWLVDGAVVTTVPWVGSSDLRATVAANAMALFPSGDRTFAAGEIVDVIEW